MCGCVLYKQDLTYKLMIAQIWREIVCHMAMGSGTRFTLYHTNLCDEQFLKTYIFAFIFKLDYFIVSQQTIVWATPFFISFIFLSLPMLIKRIDTKKTNVETFCVEFCVELLQFKKYHSIISWCSLKWWTQVGKWTWIWTWNRKV